MGLKERRKLTSCLTTCSSKLQNLQSWLEMSSLHQEGRRASTNLSSKLIYLSCHDSNLGLHQLLLLDLLHIASRSLHVQMLADLMLA